MPGRSAAAGGLFALGLALACLLMACSPTGASDPTAAVRPTGPPQPSTELTIFAASSLTDAFKEIGAAFEAANPGVKVSFSFGASSQLRTQIEQGASADLFASADQAQMDRARQADLLQGDARVFARNRLVVIVPPGNPGRVRELADLARPGLKLVTAGPEVPVGVYTQAVLERMAQEPAFGGDFMERVNANVVSREPNVRQVVAKVQLGEADAAIVYASDVTPDVAPKLGRLELPDRFNVLANYPIAALRGAPSEQTAERFIAYLLSPAGQTALAKWGFIPAN
jgi:molybdate transport system substrate-binding protein